jgi:hypothetical protein
MQLSSGLDRISADARLRSLVKDIAERSPCMPNPASTDQVALPLVREDGGQVALYLTRRHISIAVEPEGSRQLAARLGGARVESKSRRTHYVNLHADVLQDAGRYADAVTACLEALDTVGRRTGRERDVTAAAPRDFGTCRIHGYTLSARGDCPSSDEE